MCELERGIIGCVIVRHDPCTFSRSDGVAVHISAHCRGQHHTRAVVVGENQRPLSRAGRKNNGAGAQSGDQLARLAASWIASTIIAPLHKRYRSTLIQPQCRRAAQDFNVRERLELRLNLEAPLFGGAHHTFQEQASAQE